MIFFFSYFESKKQDLDDHATEVQWVSVCVCVCWWLILIFTCFIAVVTAVLHSSKDARQAGLPDPVLPEQNHLVHLGVRLAAGGDDRVWGVRGAAAPVLLAGGVGRAAQQVGQLVRLSGLRRGGAQVPVVHRHASPVHVGQIHGEGHAPSPLVHAPQFVILIQSHLSDEVRSVDRRAVRKYASFGSVLRMETCQCGQIESQIYLIS